MNMKRTFLQTVLLAAVTLLVATTARAADGTVMWTNIFNGAANNADVAQALTVDGSGNVYVTGISVGIGSSYDYATIKYSGAGVPLWTNVFNGAANKDDRASALAVDGSGNLIVTGSSMAANGFYDYATIKYSGAGLPLWTNLFNSIGNNYYSQPPLLAVDGNGNVVVTGFTTGSGSSLDYATIKYSSAGVPLWTNLFNGAANNTDQAIALAVDGSGNVLVAGWSKAANGYYDYATIKYSSAGTPVWTNIFNGAGNSEDYASSLAVDGSGNVFVTGYATAANGYYDYATIKYSSAGVPLWTNVFNGAGNGSDYTKALAVDGIGNVFVTGYSLSGSSYDYATIKYSSAGVPLWTNLFNGAANKSDVANALAVDGSGNVFVTGGSSSSGIYSGNDFATIKYSGSVPPSITTQPTNQAVMVTSNAAFSVTATGDAPLAYQWFKNNGKLANGGNVSGATTNTLSLTNVSVTNPGYYQVIVTNLAGSATSSVATLTVSNLPLVMLVGKGYLGVTNKQLWLTLAGPASSNAVISASTNLQNWIPLITNPLTIGSLLFTDSLATNYPKRFYRATLQP